MDRPVRNSEFVFEQDDADFTLINTSTGDEIQCNAIIHLIWQLCDGNTSVEEMTILLADAYPDSSSEIATDINAAIQTLKQVGAVIDN